MAKIKIKRGLDIKLEGNAQCVIINSTAKEIAIKPPDFKGLIPKILVSIGQKVQAGTPLFYDKLRTKITVTSPVSGIITEIVRGEKRQIEAIKITVDANIEYLPFEIAPIPSLSREQIINTMLQSGVWAMLRQRPYGYIASPEDLPKSIFISTFDTAPLAPDYDFVIHRQGAYFQAGLDILARLTNGTVYLNLPDRKNGISDIFLQSKNVQLNFFKGCHPAGNIGTQINKIDPINKGEVVWYLRPQEVISIGALFLDGKYNATRIIAFTGHAVTKACYFRTIIGASISELAAQAHVLLENTRYISGNVLTGTNVGSQGYLSFYDNQITVITEGNHYELLGWMMPRFRKFSFWRTYLSWITPNKRYRLDTNLNGAERAFVFNGRYRKVFPFDIFPVELMKAVMTNDIEMMEKLGIYELEEEDVALCEFICPSKIEWQAELRRGLDMLYTEMS